MPHLVILILPLLISLMSVSLVLVLKQLAHGDQLLKRLMRRAAKTLAVSEPGMAVFWGRFGVVARLLIPATASGTEYGVAVGLWIY